MPLTLKEKYLQSARRGCLELQFLDDDSVIEARTEFLRPDERDLMRAVLIYGQPVKIIAKLSHIHPAAARRRIRKLIDRISSPEFVGAVRSLHLLSTEQEAVARHHIFLGKPLHTTARDTGLGYHATRRLLVEINGIIEGMQNLGKYYPLRKTQFYSPRKKKCTA